MTNWIKRRIMHIATWNIRSFDTKDQNTMKELEDHIDICGLQETNEKKKGRKHYGE